MKNTLRKIVISTMIAVTAATAAIAPAATVVMANDGFEAIYENGYKYYYSSLRFFRQSRIPAAQISPVPMQM